MTSKAVAENQTVTKTTICDRCGVHLFPEPGFGPSQYEVQKMLELSVNGRVLWWTPQDGIVG